jgi:ribosomal protein S18 acetylase RimI-like enzyme
MGIISRTIRDSHEHTPPLSADITIAPASPDRLQAVLELWERVPGRSSVAEDEHVLRTLLEGDAEALLVAARDGELVGSLVAVWDGWRGNLYRLAVHPHHRRKGIALALVRAGEARLRGLGARRITALVERDDPAAMGFWRAAGYEPDESIARLVRTWR